MSVLDEFVRHRESVRKLVNFDRDILDFVNETLRRHIDQQKGRGITNPQQTGENLLRVLEPIRNNDSLRSRYQTVFNQALVLLVSHFGSTLNSLFVAAVRQTVINGSRDSSILKEKVTFTVEELSDPAFEAKESIANALAFASDVSWQDMQSVHRTLKKHFDINIERDPIVNDIIVAQACRNAIVHAGAIADERLVRQLKNAKPRTVKESIGVGNAIQFSTDEIEVVGNQMTSYLQKLHHLTIKAVPGLAK